MNSLSGRQVGLALLLVSGTGGAYYSLRSNLSKKVEKERVAMDKVYQKDIENSIAKLDHKLLHEKEEREVKDLPNNNTSSANASGTGSDKKLQTESASQDKCASSKKIESFP